MVFFSNMYTVTPKDIVMIIIYKTWARPAISIFWDFSIFYQIFLLPQVKQYAIITYKHSIYDLRLN